jgi:hypothetical protein
VVATERQAAVEVAEGFTAAGAKTTTELEEQGKVFRVVDGNLEIELEPYTGSLVKLSTEKASGSIGLLITVISVAVAGIAALLIGLFAK